MFLKLRHGITGRKPEIFINSIPKSGTHAFKALFKMAGYSFEGHLPHNFNLEELSEYSQPKSFVTAHTLQVPSCNTCVLTVRHPINVIISQLNYIYSRRDHKKHTIFKKLTKFEAVEMLVNGSKYIESVDTRFSNYYDWYKKSDAKILQYENVFQDRSFQSLSEIISTLSEKDILAARNAWTPTKWKRDHLDIDVKNFLNDLYERNTNGIRDIYETLISYN